MPVVGTAGHVDHGKSTLVKRLTGLEPDRWAEEQARGLTIDLGFAWTRLRDGTDVSFVDVPGHDRFIKNMLAGVESIDVALFVVAADEGWMPQSEEHLAVLDLLEVSRAVVALTKIDRVDADLIELATLEVEEHLEGTSLAGSTIIGVSSHTGVGIDDLVEALAVELATVDAGDVGRPRLWIDRAFSIQGTGTVVTGTLLGGSVAVGDELFVSPSGTKVRVRGLQSHEEERDRTAPGSRVALNISGAERETLRRGTMLGRADEWMSSRRILASIRSARYVDELTDRGAYHLHVGSGSWPIRIRHLGPSLVRIDLEDPIPTAMGDRFVVRDSGRRLVVGGGRVLDPDFSNRIEVNSDKVRSLNEALDGDADQRADALLAFRGSDSTARLAAHSGGGSPSRGSTAAGVWLSADEQMGASAALEAMVAAYHADHPLRPGLGVAEAATTLGVPVPLVATLISSINGIELRAAQVVSESFSVAFTPNQSNQIDAVASQLAAAGRAAVPRISDLPIDGTVLHAAVRAGRFVQVSSDFVYLPSQVDELLAVITSFDEPFGVSDFKDRAGLSRKYAVPFLEWADASGRTVRIGDLRRRRD